MNWKQILNGLVTAAASGGAAAVAVNTYDPQHVDLHRTLVVFAGGAFLGVVNWLRKSPWAAQTGA